MTAPPYDTESALIGCVVCGYVDDAPIRIFSCNCHLPIHDICISTWREKGGTCPFCEQEWLVVTPALAQPLLPLLVRRRRDNCRPVAIGACIAIACIILVATGISAFFYFRRVT